MRIKLLLAILILAYQLPFYASISNDIYFYHLGVEDGLSQINIMSIYQDESGAMWFGTIEGLNRYNGREIETFRDLDGVNGLSQNMIHSIEGNKSGYLYIHADDELVKYNISTQKFSTIHSNNRIKAIAYHDNSLWIATNRDIMRLNEESGILQDTIHLNQNNNTTLYLTSERKLYVGSTKGLTIIYLDKPTIQESILNDEHITCIFEDSHKNLYVGTHVNGIYMIDALSGKITNHKYKSNTNSISNNRIRTIIEDNQGKIWIGTFFGLNQYDPKSKVWKNYVNNDNISYSLSHNSIFALFKDVQGTIWVGTYFGGVNFFNTEVDMFRYYGASSGNSNYLSFPFVSKMTEDDTNNLWICTEGGALNRLNLKNKEFSRYIFKRDDLETAEYNNLKSIWYRKDKKLLYIGLYNGGLIIFDTKNKTFRRLLENKNIPNSLPNNSINEIQYYNGDLILLTQSGLVKMDLEKETFHPISDNPAIIDGISDIRLYTFLIDSKNRLWVQKDGITSVDLKTGEVKSFKQDQSGNSSISKSNITDIFESSTGDIWFTTIGYGAFRWRQGEIESYTKDKKRLKNDYCFSIAELPSGNLILLHNKGISFINPEKKCLVASPKFPSTGFNLGSSVHTTKNNETFIGGVNGLLSFYEEGINSTENKYSIYFDKLYLNSHRVVPGDKSEILDRALFLCDEIKLKHNQNNITIEFASSNYLGNSDSNYEYMLEGFDEDWIHTNNTKINYTNLSPGRYRLHVRDLQYENETFASTYTLSINVSLPFYSSLPAFILYFIVVTLIIIAVAKFYSWRTKLETRVEYERREKERIEELNQTKLRFFTNLSHEFRIPLTLISIQLETLLSLSEVSGKIRNKLLRIQKSSTLLLSLITELLDFKKQEHSYKKLSIQHTELVKYIKEISDIFQEYISKKRLKYSIDSSEAEIYAYIDPIQFKKVIYNLLSNAIKFTAEGGNIKINIKKKQQSVCIEIIDNGVGMPADALSKIFDRFYQLEHRASGLTSGTGIGLALTKEIVSAHKGEIQVESILNEGSKFTITLKLGTSHFSEEELAQDGKNINSAIVYPLEDIFFKDTDIEDDIVMQDTDLQITDKSKPSVLLAEDSEELLNLLSESFLPYYEVFTADNGQTALDIILAEQPDIVVSDIIMPELSGKELCYRIKNNPNTSHIPVVLLTAQSADNQIIEGLMFGADAYLTKPFNLGILISTCNTLLKNRKLMYGKFFSQVKTVDHVSINEYDQAFIDKACEIIKNNFENPNFDMTQLGAELGIGRSKLYTTFKEITGFTPNEFTLNIKLKEAVNYIENFPHLNVSDIAYRLGFNSSKYFSKCFKTFYGIRPQEWRKKANKNEDE